MDLTYEISTLLLLLGYSLFILGLCSHAWKDETGYNYGLWYRCDHGDCDFYSVDYFDLINIVRIGAVVSALILTATTSCLLIEAGMVICRHRSRHRTRIGKAIGIVAFCGGLLASGSIALYGYKAIHKNHKLPVLLWGFASTGLGIISFLLGIILRTMGPVATWDKLLCISHPISGQIDSRNKRTTCSNDTIGHYKRKPTDRQLNRGRPKGLNITHPTDIIMYKKAAQNYFDTSASGCSSDHLLIRQDSNPSPHHGYEELPLTRRYENTCQRQSHGNITQRLGINSPRLNTLPSNKQLRIIHNPNTGTFSNQPSPRLLRELDLAPRQATSLPPGISPGFYNKPQGTTPQRHENQYEIDPAFRRQPSLQHFQARTIQSLPHGSHNMLPIDRFRPLHSPRSAMSNPAGQSTPRSVRLISFDTSSVQSSSSATTPSPPPPPSPPLPPPPPSLLPTSDYDQPISSFNPSSQTFNYDQPNFSVYNFGTHKY